ncbi:glycosyltransferase family 4 protein [Methanobacterium sp.]|uniref:glycosyltransferase family 4 protein n=1 Tax=Methanobacterium sp. TaxID=2164 RepID=UPI003C753C7E
MEIDYISGPKTDKIFGMTKYELEIIKRIDINFNIIQYNSLMKYFEKNYAKNLTPKTYSPKTEKGVKTENRSNFLMEMGKNTLRFIDKQLYIRTVKNKVKKGNIKHITSQEYAYLLNSVKLENNMVTCYDLIPWVYDNNRSSLWKQNMNGLKQAETIITISEFSRDEIVKYLDYPKEMIEIVYPAVDHTNYNPTDDKKILLKLNIPTDQKVVLYVGSEVPRQNVPVLIKAFALLKKKIPDIKLVKIGDPQSYGARESVLQLINELELSDDVIFAGYVPEEDMPKWYNAADILVYPCDYAGFGLPPLEAMACGTPVITSNTTSLPEVVGDAGIMINPQDFELMAAKMYDVLTDNKLKDKMINNGLRRSKLFNWDDSARKTLEIYKNNSNL